jgi:hypothetical protein
MGLPTFDLSSWPLVVIVAPADAATDAEMATHLARVAELYKRGGPFALVVDVRFAPQPPPGQRRMLSDALSAHEKTHPKQLRALAMTVRSTVQRGVITAISWAFPPPYPMQIFTDPAEAAAWATGKLGLASHEGAKP